jgi:hypothetical protein
MQREFDIWEIFLRKVMKVGISVPNKAMNQFKKQTIPTGIEESPTGS